MKKLFTKEQEEIILNLYNDHSYSEIAIILNCNVSNKQVRGWLNNNGYKKDSRSTFSVEQQQYIRNNYVSRTYKEIANEIGKSEKQVKGWINNNCKSKLRDFDKNYFHSIDSMNKAYWVGFIYADGWVRTCKKNDEHSQYELGIELKSSDEGHLEKFNKELGGVHRITHSSFTGTIYRNNVLSHTESSILRIYSKNIVDDLIAINVLPNKTDRNEYPVIDKYFIDFLRGYIDGDGCIYISKRGYLQVTITSCHRDILDYIREMTKSLYGIDSYVYSENNRKYRIYFNGKNALELLDFLYKNSNKNNRLDRKYDIYTRYIDTKGRHAKNIA